jgi:hypothetical protein
MSVPDRPTEHELETLVRAYLEKGERAIDAQRILAGVQRRLANSRPARHRWAPMGWAMGVAAAVVLMAGGLYFGTPSARAETLVAQARDLAIAPLDRCYDVLVEPEAEVRNPLLRRATFHHNRLWTRGDRFWVETVDPPHRWAWGRDEQGRAWLAEMPTAGARFNAEELPEELNTACEIRTLRLDTLLNELLTDFDLRWEPVEPGADPTVRRVRAVWKEGHHHRRCREAVLDIDTSTKVVRRMVLSLLWRDQPTARVTYTLTSTGTQDDASYRPEGHLDAGAPIYEGKRARAMFLRFMLTGQRPAKPSDG